MSKVKEFNFFFLWLGAAISISEILTGTVLAPLGLIKGLIVIILGHLIGTYLLVLGGVIGTKENETAIGSTQAAFGQYGKVLFAILNVIQLLGWTAVMFKTGGEQLFVISHHVGLFHHAYIGILIIGIVTVAWMAIGFKNMTRLNSVAVVLLFGLSLVVFIQLLIHGHFNLAASKGLSFGAGLELTIVMPISWLPVIADYNRHGHSAKRVAVGSWLGYCLGSAWMYSVGLLIGLSHLSLNGFFGKTVLIAMVIIILSTVTTTFLDARSASVSFLLLFPKFNARMVTIIMGVIGLILALVIPMSQYENFLYLIGSFFSPLYAIVLTDYFILKRKKKGSSILVQYLPAFAIWLIGVILYNVFIKIDFILGGTLPSMVITGLLYLLVKGGMATWHLRQTSLPTVKE